MKTGDLLSIPIAHGEGNYFCDEDTLKALQDSSRIAFLAGSVEFSIPAVFSTDVQTGLTQVWQIADVPVTLECRHGRVMYEKKSGQIEEIVGLDCESEQG